jgi:hypothetical protein
MLAWQMATIGLLFCVLLALSVTYALFCVSEQVTVIAVPAMPSTATTMVSPLLTPAAAGWRRSIGLQVEAVTCP